MKKSDKKSSLKYKNKPVNSNNPYFVNKLNPRFSNIAQVTVFIILALVVLAGVAIGSYVLYENNQEKQNQDFFLRSDNVAALNSIKEDLVMCHKQISDQALVTIGIQGGYDARPSRQNLVVENSFIPYYYYEGNFLMPTLETIENEIGNNIDNQLSNCIKDIDDHGFILTSNNPLTIVKIEDDDVYLETDLVINIKKEKYMTTLNLMDAPYNKRSKLKDIYAVAKYFTDNHDEDSKMYCITCLANLVTEKNLFVDIIPLTDLITLVIISDDETEDQPYSFMFLNKYTGDEESKSIDLEIVSDEDLNKIPEPLSGELE